MIKRLLAFLAAAAALCGFSGCGSQPPEPELSRMKAICELAVMDCYYHNVAKYYEEGTLFLRDKQFWVEYSGVVRLGIDASLVEMSVDGENVSVTLPEAKVLSCRVDSSSLTPESFIVAEGSKKISAEDEIEAFDKAQEQLNAQAAADTALLNNARERARALLEDYINNFGELFGVDYNIEFEYLSAAPSGSAPDETPAVSA